MTAATSRALRRAMRAALALSGICAALAAGGCGTSDPKLILSSELAEAQTFPFYRVYWVGASFDGRPLAAVDGLKGYISSVGDSVYYGDCLQSKGIFGGGSCQLPLQVTTIVYSLHPNAALGPQRNTLIRGVPATVYDEGRSIELYTGRLAIEVFSDSFAHALQASDELRPINAPGASSGDLPPPVYCPELSGHVGASVARVMASLPARVCQRAGAQDAYTKAITGKS